MKYLSTCIILCLQISGLLAQRTEIKNLASREFLQMFLYQFADPQFKTFIKNDSLLLANGYKSVKFPGEVALKGVYPHLDVQPGEYYLNKPGEIYKVKISHKKGSYEYPISSGYYFLGMDLWWKKKPAEFTLTYTALGLPDTLWTVSSLNVYAAYKFVYDENKLKYIDEIFKDGSTAHCMTFRYDEDGLLFEYFDVLFRRSLNYDSNKRVVSIIHGYTNLVSGTPYQINYEYDEMGRLKKSFMTFSTHSYAKDEILYAYNDLGLIVSINGRKINYNK